MIGALATSSVPPPRPSGSLAEFLLYLGIAIVLVVGTGIALVIYRRRVLAEDASDARARTLDAIRAMRDRGEMTPAEYDAARRAAIAGFTEPTTPAKAREPAPPRRSAHPTPGPGTTPAPPGGERIAPPGLDLTGAPLPRSRDETSGE